MVRDSSERTGYSVTPDWGSQKTVPCGTDLEAETKKTNLNYKESEEKSLPGGEKNTNKDSAEEKKSGALREQKGVQSLVKDEKSGQGKLQRWTQASVPGLANRLWSRLSETLRGFNPHKSSQNTD